MLIKYKFAILATVLLSNRTNLIKKLTQKVYYINNLQPHIPNRVRCHLKLQKSITDRQNCLIGINLRKKSAANACIPIPLLYFCLKF